MCAFSWLCLQLVVPPAGCASSWCAFSWTASSRSVRLFPAFGGQWLNGAVLVLRRRAGETIAIDVYHGRREPDAKTYRRLADMCCRRYTGHPERIGRTRARHDDGYVSG